MPNKTPAQYIQEAEGWLAQYERFQLRHHLAHAYSALGNALKELKKDGNSANGT